MACANKPTDGDASPSLVESLCAYFSCENAVGLRRVLEKPAWSMRAAYFLRGRKLRTLHFKRLPNVQVKFGGLTLVGADSLPAYNGYLSINVQQHYYAAHNIRLKYPRLACVVVHGGNGHRDYYPLELLTLC